MTALSDARAHLDKAREFLQAAEINRDVELYNAATSELKAAGPVGATLAPTLGRLLRLKTKSQYQSVSISASDATKAVSGPNGCSLVLRMLSPTAEFEVMGAASSSVLASELVAGRTERALVTSN